MSTVERIMGGAFGRPVSALQAGLWSAVKALFRVLRNRREVTRLCDLDDHQLYDIGLTRMDVERALTTSPFFQDPSSHIVLSARRRIRGRDRP